MAEHILVQGIRVAKSWEPETFGRLTTIGPAFRLGGRYYCVCSCLCGNIGVYQTVHLRSGHTSSCRCAAKEATKLRSYKHGGAKRGANTVEYTTRGRMLARCGNCNHPDYPDYGGRGIRVCDRWLGESGFQNFLEDMGPRPPWANSIDRKDPNGHYCPENCRWATDREQANNRRTTIVLEVDGQKKPLQDWALLYGIKPQTIWNRLKKLGWSDKDAVTIPVRGSLPNHEH